MVSRTLHIKIKSLLAKAKPTFYQLLSMVEHRASSGALGLLVQSFGIRALGLLVRLVGSEVSNERLKSLDVPLEQLGLRPEVLFLHKSVMALVATRNYGSGLAFLALTWSTVVLLGGFISELRVKEFWFLTTTSFIMASG